jgi:hypothetical protein
MKDVFTGAILDFDNEIRGDCPWTELLLLIQAKPELGRLVNLGEDWGERNLLE